MYRSVRLSYALVVAFATPVFAFAQVNPPTVVVKTGDAAPGLPGLTFGTSQPQTFVTPVINGTGTIGFFGAVAGPGVTEGINDTSIWSSTGGTHTLIARNGSAAPGVSGANFSAFFSTGAIADTGLIAFNAQVAGVGVTAGTNDRGIWAGSAGNGLSLVARGGDVAPGTGGAVWANLSASPLVLPGGQIYLSASLVQGGSVTASNDSAFWLGTPGNLSVLIREGDAVATLPGVNLGVPNLAGFNASGVAFVRSGLTGTGVTGTNNTLVQVGTAGNFTPLMRTGDTPNGASAGQTVVSFSTVGAVLANGSVYFAAGLTGTGITTANDTGIWVGSTPANLVNVIREGDQYPNLPAGVLFGGVGIPRAFGNTVVFSSTVTGTGVTTANDHYVGAWSQATGFRPVAREGNAAPGAGGAVFGTFVNVPSPLGGATAPIIGPDGSIAFRALLTGTGVTTGVNDAAIWIEQGGTLRLVARKGDVINLGAGQGTGTIAELALIDNLNGMPIGSSALANDGGLAWLATLTDGRSVVFFTPVPEPASLLALSALGLYAVARSGGSRKNRTKTTSATA